MSNRSPEDVVRQMYTAFGASNEAGLREVINADVEWNQCAGFPGGERRRGIDSVLAGVLHGNKSMWTGFKAAVSDYIASADRVVAIGYYEGTHSQTGKSMRADFTHTYRILNGQIIRFDQVADTWPMVSAAQV
jgi:ketosteroid isomerase-like protein